MSYILIGNSFFLYQSCNIFNSKTNVLQEYVIFRLVTYLRVTPSVNIFFLPSYWFTRQTTLLYFRLLPKHITTWLITQCLYIIFIFVSNTSIAFHYNAPPPSCCVSAAALSKRDIQVWYRNTWHRLARVQVVPPHLSFSAGNCLRRMSWVPLPNLLLSLPHTSAPSFSTFPVLSYFLSPPPFVLPVPCLIASFCNFSSISGLFVFHM